MQNDKRKRLANLEQQAQGKETVIAVVDVRDLAPAQATEAISAKRTELEHTVAKAVLIILKHEGR